MTAGIDVFLVFAKTLSVIKSSGILLYSFGPAEANDRLIICIVNIWYIPIAWHACVCHNILVLTYTSLNLTGSWYYLFGITSSERLSKPGPLLA